MMLHRMQRPVNTLVVHTGGIGDFLLFCPALKRLAEDGAVELAGMDRDRLNLAVSCGLARSAHLLDEFDFGSVFTGPSTRFRAFIERFDRAIVWMNDEDGKILNAFAPVREVRVFAGLPPRGWRRHASEYYAAQLGFEDLPPLVLPFVADDEAHDVLIHPGSGGAWKNWPLDMFAEVADALNAIGRTIEWIRGPAELELRYPKQARILEVSSVVTLARQLSNAKLYIGNDSGITHLAAACGCRTVAVFGATNANVWAPKGKHVMVVGNAGWPTVGEVMGACRD